MEEKGNWDGVVGDALTQPQPAVSEQPDENIQADAEQPTSDTQAGMPTAQLTESMNIVSPEEANDDGMFRPLVFEPPEWVHKRLGRHEGMIYVYVNRQSAITALFGWIMLAAIGIIGSAYLLVVMPADLLLIVPVLLVISMIMPLYKWYMWKITIYPITINTSSGKKHIRRARNIPTLLRPFFGPASSRAAPFEKIASVGFEATTIDGFLKTTTLSGDTAAQEGDAWLNKELRHLKNGRYLENLNTWMQQH